MYKGNDVIGKPVVSFSSGEILERIKDVLFDAVSRRVSGFLVGEKGLFAKARILPFGKVKAIGVDAITVEDKNAVVEAVSPQDEQMAESGNVAKGTKVLTEDGKNLGTIADLFFDEKSGEIKGYEVSGGMFADAYSGKSFLPAPQTLKIGRDVAFVPPETVEIIKQQAGGVKGMAQKAGQAAGGMKDKAAGGFQQTKNQATDSVRQGTVSATGLRDGLTPEQRVRDASRKARVGMEQARSATDKAWENVKNKAAELTGRAMDKTEEKRIEAAVGKPVTRVVLDKRDQVILNTGELITHEAVNKARAAGVLNILLNSVYRQEPTFSSDELKSKSVEE